MSIASRIRAGREPSKSRRTFRAKSSRRSNGKPEAQPDPQPRSELPVTWAKPSSLQTGKKASEPDAKLAPHPPPAASSATEVPEIERLRGENDRLKREVQSHQDASDRWECPDGFMIDTDRVEVDIEGAPGKAAARVHHFIARHKASEWASSRHIDKTTAIRCAWMKHCELERAQVEGERDELQRRWDQRKKTQESKAKKGADAEG